MVVGTEGTIFKLSCSALSPASPFLCMALTPGVTASVGDRAGCVGVGNGDGRKKFRVALTWGHCQRWGPGRVWAREMVMAGKSFSVFLKSFSLFVIRDIPFLGSPITFFDIPMRTDSG